MTSGCVWPDSPTVDPVMAEQRAASFAKRSIKRESKMAALKLAISMLDLTTLEGADTPEKVRGLCRKAVRVWERDEEVLGERLPSVAAVCVYPSMVGVAREAIEGFQRHSSESCATSSQGGCAASSQGGCAISSQGGCATGVKVASVATGFPSGQYPLRVRLEDVRLAIESGADEIDMVINRGAFLAGRYGEVLEEIREVALVCAGEAPASPITAQRAVPPEPITAQRAVPREPNTVQRAVPREPNTVQRAVPAAIHLKVILETGELGTLDAVRRASDLAIAALSESGLTKERGAAFIKTSTGKVSPAATMPVTLVMLHAIRDHYLRTGEMVGMKPAGGIRTAKQAVQYLVMVQETMGAEGAKARRHGGTEVGAGRHSHAHVAMAPGHGEARCAWLSASLFRFGASSLANDLVRQVIKQTTGSYVAGYDVSEV